MKHSLRFMLSAALCVLALSVSGCDKKADDAAKKEGSGKAEAQEKEEAKDPCALLAACAEAWPDAKPMYDGATASPDTAADMCAQIMSGLYYNDAAPEVCKTLPKER